MPLAPRLKRVPPASRPAAPPGSPGPTPAPRSGRDDKKTALVDIAKGLELFAELLAQDGLAHPPLRGLRREFLDSPDQGSRESRLFFGGVPLLLRILVQAINFDLGRRRRGGREGGQGFRTGWVGPDGAPPGGAC